MLTTHEILNRHETWNLVITAHICNVNQIIMLTTHEILNEYKSMHNIQLGGNQGKNEIQFSWFAWLW